MVGGLSFANDLSSWLPGPSDPDSQIIASAHVYSDFSCSFVACWNEYYAPVSAVVPVVTGELGEFDCGQTFIDTYMQWADENGVSYLGWAWNTTTGPTDQWTCDGGPSLITSYSGDPTAFGLGLRTQLAALFDEGAILEG
jgi:hypothetical protein